MIQSMTGFGIATESSDRYTVTVELKSLNSKYLEIGLKVPRAYMRHEHHVRNYLTKELERGKVMMLMNVDSNLPGKSSLNIRTDILKKHHDALLAIQQELGIATGVSLEYLLTLPEVLDESVEGDPEEWKLIEAAIHAAVKQLNKSRIEEGLSIAVDFEERLAAIETALASIEELTPKRIDDIRTRIYNQLEELKARLEVDTNRFEQEMIYYLERLDINEEIVRLKQHLVFFRKTQSEKSSNGKTLNFIAQEMGREINTIGSKANDAALQRLVVGMKDELERIKEQVNNIV